MASLLGLAKPSGLIPVPFQVRNVSARSHSASKKRFKPRGSGGMVYKPSGRKHGMHRHSRNRNRSKGAAVVINRAENGDLWRKLRSMSIKLKEKSVPKPHKKVYAGEEVVFKFSSQILNNKGLLSVVATEVTPSMAPTVVQTKKKTQWRAVS
jgi:ribosomal protein L35